MRIHLSKSWTMTAIDRVVERCLGWKFSWFQWNGVSQNFQKRLQVQGCKHPLTPLLQGEGEEYQWKGTWVGLYIFVRWAAWVMAEDTILGSLVAIMQWSLPTLLYLQMLNRILYRLRSHAHPQAADWGAFHSLKKDRATGYDSQRNATWFELLRPHTQGVSDFSEAYNGMLIGRESSGKLPNFHSCPRDGPCSAQEVFTQKNFSAQWKTIFRQWTSSQWCFREHFSFIVEQRIDIGMKRYIWTCINWSNIVITN